jgi:hypothetical protein
MYSEQGISGIRPDMDTRIGNWYSAGRNGEHRMSIRDWPEGERPREKLLKLGAGALSEAELIAIFLRTGVRGRSALDVARDLLNEFGSVRGLLTADGTTLCKARVWALRAMQPCKRCWNWHAVLSGTDAIRPGIAPPTSNTRLPAHAPARSAP